jgi:hypothetical protein
MIYNIIKKLIIVVSILAVLTHQILFGFIICLIALMPLFHRKIFQELLPIRKRL